MTGTATDRTVATCVFGSVARGDSDGISDKDILIVSANSAQRALESAVWRARGWSIASYTPRRLVTMSHAGSLFLQHLKSEGLVLNDEDGLLRDILSSYRPRADYSSDVSDCLEALRLIEGCRSTPLMSYWAADVLFVIFRNASILHLANDRIYKFSFAEIAQTLRERGNICSDDLQTLAALRKAKAAFRSRTFQPTDAWPTVDGVLRIMERVFGKSVSRISAFHSSPASLDDPYFSLRGIEKLLLEQGLTEDSPHRSDAVRQVWKMIVDPRAYSWDIKVHHRALADDIHNMLKGRNQAKLLIPGTGATMDEAKQLILP